MSNQHEIIVRNKPIEEKREDACNTLLRSISHTLGEEVADALVDEKVIEIMLNPDGSLWIEKFGSPMERVGSLTPEKAELALKLIASAMEFSISKETPIVEGEFPIDNSRFQGLVHPITKSASFAIRKKANKVFTLDEYVESGGINLEAKDILETAILNHKNIIVAGGTGSDKTTFVNALIEAIDRLTREDRLVIIEDTRELQAKSPNRIELRSTDFVTMQDLLKATLRLRPDRILVGEVRDVAALALVKAWNTGHEGGLGTIHANSAEETMDRLEELILEGGYQAIKKVLARAIHYIVFMKKHQGTRRVFEIAEVGYDKTANDYTFDYKYTFLETDKTIKKIMAA